MKAVDAVIFDCDGVLVDVSESYDAAIAATVKSALTRFAGISSAPVDGAMIEGFKSTGGFNNEIDLAYAAVLSLVAANRLDTDPHLLIRDVIRGADASGIASVERYLNLRVDLADIRKKMAYPGTGDGSPLGAMFDQVFYGADLYEKITGQKAEVRTSGFIECDRLILSRTLLDGIVRCVRGRLAMVTGRGLDSVRHSLGAMLDSFDLDSCVFLEDEPRYLAKPNPESLRRSISSLSAGNALYVGDSMEDIIMAKAVARENGRVIFCGITGTSRDPGARSRMFEQRGADIIVDSIHDIPDVVEFA